MELWKVARAGMARPGWLLVRGTLREVMAVRIGANRFVAGGARAAGGGRSKFACGRNGLRHRRATLVYGTFASLAAVSGLPPEERRWSACGRGRPAVPERKPAGRLDPVDGGV